MTTETINSTDLSYRLNQLSLSLSKKDVSISELKHLDIIYENEPSDPIDLSDGIEEQKSFSDFEILQNLEKYLPKCIDQCQKKSLEFEELSCDAILQSLNTLLSVPKIRFFIPMRFLKLPDVQFDDEYSKHQKILDSLQKLSFLTGLMCRFHNIECLSSFSAICNLNLANNVLGILFKKYQHFVELDFVENYNTCHDILWMLIEIVNDQQELLETLKEEQNVEFREIITRIEKSWMNVLKIQEFQIQNLITMLQNRKNQWIENLDDENLYGYC